MEDRTRIAARERWRQLIAPLAREPVGLKRIVLCDELLALLLIGGESEAAGRPEGISGDLGEVGYGTLGPLPELSCALAPDRLDHDGVRGRAAPERKSAVPPTRPSGDFSRLVQTDSQAGFGQRERTRAARDAAPDDRDVWRTVELDGRKRLIRLGEPVRGRGHGSRSYAGGRGEIGMSRYRSSVGPNALGCDVPSYSHPSRS